MRRCGHCDLIRLSPQQRESGFRNEELGEEDQNAGAGQSGKNHGQALGGYSRSEHQNVHGQCINSVPFLAPLRLVISTRANTRKMPRSGARTTQTHAKGHVGCTEPLHQRIAGFMLQLLQAGCIDADPGLIGTGPPLPWELTGHLKHNFAHIQPAITPQS